MRLTKGIMVLSCLLLGIPVSAQLRQDFKLKPMSIEERQMLDNAPRWRYSRSGVNVKLPNSVDNSNNKFFPAVFNQEGNSCAQASGVRYVFSYEVNRMLNRDAKSAKENVFAYHFTWNYLNEGDNWGSYTHHGYEIMKTTGCPTLADMSDTEVGNNLSATKWMNGYDKYLRAMKYKVASYRIINLKTQEGIDNLKHYLYNHGEDGASTGGVVSFSCESNNWGYYPYKGPSETHINHIVATNGNEGSHAMTIVGYDDTVEFDVNGDAKITDDEKGAFIVMNSWGDDWWGTKGKCYMPYKMFRDPWIRGGGGGLWKEHADAFVVTPAISEPKVVFKVSLTYDSRNDLSFQLGVAEGQEATKPSVVMDYPIMKNQGGEWRMCGKSTQENFNSIEVGLNLTDMLPEFENFKDPQYFLIIKRGLVAEDDKYLGSGRVNSFEVIDYRTGKTIVSKQKGVKLDGKTVLSTSPLAKEKVSANPVGWLEEDGNTAVSNPFIILTSDGEQKKMQFVEYDAKNGTVKIRYNSLH